MILASLRIVSAPEKRNEVMLTLHSLLEPTRVQPGCIGCCFHHDAENENTFTFVEEWKTQEDLERHLRSDQYQKLLALMDTSTEPPEIKFKKISETFGMEYLAAVRGSRL